MRRKTKSFNTGRREGVAGEFRGLVILLFVFCFILTGVGFAGGTVGNPWDDPGRDPFKTCAAGSGKVDHQRDRDFPLDPPTLGIPPGSGSPLVVGLADLPIEELVPARKGIVSSLTWVVWFGFLMPPSN